MKIKANRQKAIEDVADTLGLTKLEVATIDKIYRSKTVLTINDFPAIQRAIIPKMEYEFFNGLRDGNDPIKLYPEGEKIAQQVECRLQTLKAIKDGLYMFPEYVLQKVV